MSLNGLEEKDVNEAYQSVLTDGGNWFLLKYSSRDQVELYRRGTTGLAEVQDAVAQFQDDAPLFGVIHYRRRKVILKYAPAGISRLLQARVAVHFPLIEDRFRPHDAVFAFSDPPALKDSALAALLTLHTAGSKLSAEGSLAEIKEDDIDAKSDSTPKQPAPEIISSPTPAVPQPPEDKEAAQQARHEKVTEILNSMRNQNRDSTASSVTQRPSRSSSDTQKPLPPQPAEPETRSLAPQDTNPRPSFSSQFTARTSTSSLRPSLVDLERAYEYKPKIKLGPRPSSDSLNRPGSSGSFRPVSSLPAGLRMPSRKAAPARLSQAPPPNAKSPPHKPLISPTQRSITSVTSRPLTSPTSSISSSSTAKPKPPLKLGGPAPFQPAGHLPTPIDLTASKNGKLTPEKRRLMKALELRQKQQAIKSQQTSPKDDTATPSPATDTTKHVEEQESQGLGIQSPPPQTVDDLPKINGNGNGNGNISTPKNGVDQGPNQEIQRASPDSPVSAPEPEPSEGQSTQASSISDADASAEAEAQTEEDSVGEVRGVKAGHGSENTVRAEHQDDKNGGLGEDVKDVDAEAQEVVEQRDKDVGDVKGAGDEQGSSEMGKVEGETADASDEQGAEQTEKNAKSTDANDGRHPRQFEHILAEANKPRDTQTSSRPEQEQDTAETPLVNDTQSPSYQEQDTSGNARVNDTETPSQPEQNQQAEAHPTTEPLPNKVAAVLGLTQSEILDLPIQGRSQQSSVDSGRQGLPIHIQERSHQSSVDSGRQGLPIQSNENFASTDFNNRLDLDDQSEADKDMREFGTDVNGVPAGEQTPSKAQRLLGLAPRTSPRKAQDFSGNSHLEIDSQDSDAQSVDSADESLITLDSVRSRDAGARTPSAKDTEASQTTPKNLPNSSTNMIDRRNFVTSTSGTNGPTRAELSPTASEIPIALDPLSIPQTHASISSSASEQEISTRSARRRGVVQPLDGPSTPPQQSDDQLLLDDRLMEELKSAPVQEAKPVSVSKSPITPVFPKNSPERGWMDKPQTIRSVSSPLKFRGRENINQPPALPSPILTRSFSASNSPVLNQNSSPGPSPVTKKAGVSSSISQRIKALENLSSRPSSPNTQVPSHSAFASLRERTSSFKSLKSPKPESPSGMKPSRPSTALPSPSYSPVVERTNGVGEATRKPRPESISVTATIIRDPNHAFGAPSSFTDLNRKGLHPSPLTIERQAAEQPMRLSPLLPPRPQYARPQSGSISSASEYSKIPSPKASSRRSSLVSRRSASSRNGSDLDLPRSASEKSLPSTVVHDSDNSKRDSKRSRFLKRMSSISNMSRRSVITTLSPSPKEAPISEDASGHVNGNAPPRNSSVIMDLGDVNVQFPDTLLWKRRHLLVSPQGELVLGPTSTEKSTKIVTKRFAVTGFRAPYVPDQDRQELPHSMMLDFKEGSTLQLACETAAGQDGLFKALRGVYADHHP